jgi:hypothetical protein
MIPFLSRRLINACSAKTPFIDGSSDGFISPGFALSDDAPCAAGGDAGLSFVTGEVFSDITALARFFTSSSDALGDTMLRLLPAPQAAKSSAAHRAIQ